MSRDGISIKGIGSLRSATAAWGRPPLLKEGLLTHSSATGNAFDTCKFGLSCLTVIDIATVLRVVVTATQKALLLKVCVKSMVRDTENLTFSVELLGCTEQLSTDSVVVQCGSAADGPCLILLVRFLRRFTRRNGRK